MNLFQGDREVRDLAYRPRVGSEKRISKKVVNMTADHRRSRRRAVTNANMAQKGLKKLFGGV